MTYTLVHMNSDNHARADSHFFDEVGNERRTRRAVTVVAVTDPFELSAADSSVLGYGIVQAGCEDQNGSAPGHAPR